MTVSEKDRRGLVEEIRVLRTRLDGAEQRNARLMQAERELRENLEQLKTVCDNSPLGLYRMTPDGRILMANSTLRNMLGFNSFDELAQRDLEQEGYEPTYPRSDFKERMECEGKVTGLESAWKRSDGTTLYVRESAQAVRDESGKTLYYQGTVEDVTEHRQTRQALHESEELFAALVRNLGEGVNIVDENLRCLFANPAGEDIFGVGPGGLVGRTLYEFVSDEGHKIIDEQRSHRRQGIADSYDLEIIRPDGQKRQLIVTASPRLSEDGKYVGAMAVFFDVTEKKQAQEALRKARDEMEAKVQKRTAELQHANEALRERELSLNLALQAAQLGHWDWHIPSGRIVCSEEIYSMFGRRPEQFQSTYEGFFDFVHPSGRESIRKQIQIAITENKPLDADFRILTPDGRQRVLHCRAATFKSQTGEPLRMIGTTQDITERKQAEEALRETTGLLETVFSHTHILVAYLDSRFNFVRVNRAYAQIDGRDPSFFVGRNHFDLYPHAENEAIFRKVLEIGVPYFAHAKAFEYVEHPEWGTTYWDWSLVPIKQQDGTVSGLVLTLVNVTEQKKAELALRDSEERFRKVFAEGPLGMVLTSRDMKFFDANPAFCRMLGYTVEEMNGKTFLDVTHPAHRDADRENVEKMWRGEIPQYTMEKRYVTKKGDIRWGSVSTSLIRDQGGEPLCVIAMVEDITERKAAEESLRESEQKFRSLAEQSPNMIFINKKGRVVYANRKCEQILGYTREQLYSPDFNFRVLIAPESMGVINESFVMHSGGREVEPYDYCLVTRAGERIEAINVSKLIQYEGDTAILGIVTDITERKRAEQAIRESQERLKILFESAPDAIYVTDLDGRFVDGNKAAEDLVGFSKAELIGKTLAESGLLSAEDLTKAAANVQRVASGRPSGPTEYTVRKKSGSLIAVEVRTFPVKIAGKTLSLGIARDVTARKHAEEAVRASEQKFRTIFETAANMIISVNEQGVIVDCNDRVREVLGYEKEEILGRSMARIIHPDCIARAQSALQEILSKGFSYNKEYKMVRKDGSLIDVNINSSAIEDEQGKYVRTLCIIDDITERKRTQQRLLDDREQLKSLASQLSLTEERERHRLATLLHDHIGQSLVISKIKLDQLRKSAGGGLTQAIAEVSRIIAQMIQDTRTLTFDLSYPILYELGFEAAAAEWLTEQIEDKHGIKTEFHDDGQDKPLDEDIQALLFRNVRELLFNVVKHAQAQHVKVSVAKADKNVCVSVEDDGVGFDPADVAATAAKRAEFGLFSIRERLEQLGGYIKIDSRPARGTKITMVAPLKYEQVTDRTQK